MKKFLFSILLVSLTCVSIQATEVPETTLKVGTYYREQEVELECATEGAKIYYTIDGTEPTAESTQYKGTFTFEKSVTIKAIAIEGDDKSEVAVFDYTVAAPTEVATLADAIKVNDNEVVLLTFKPVATYQNVPNLYVKDGNTNALIYGSGVQDIDKGTKLKTGALLTKITENGLIKLTTTAGEEMSTTDCIGDSGESEDVEPA